MGDESEPMLDGRAALLGFVAGLRSQMPLAILALAAGRGDFAANATGPLRLLRSRWALVGFGAVEVGEVILDKLPIVPSRIKPAPLAGRMACGALAGAVLTRGARCPIVPGIVLGAAGAGAGSFAGYFARVTLDRVTAWPDLIWAGVEDATALGLGLLAVEGLGGSRPTANNS